VLNETVAHLASGGADVLGVVTDVAELSSVAALRDAALDRFGSVEIVFNNAGVSGGSALNSPPGVWDWVIGVNLGGVINGINTFMPLLLEQNEGHMVNTASAAGLGGVPGMGPYCATKFAVVGLSEAMFHELSLKHTDVHVSVLCPGFVKTRIHESERNIPEGLSEWAGDVEAQFLGGVAKQAVEAGIDVEIVANAVHDALLDERFWILTHERLALSTTRQRLSWMEGGELPRIDLFEAGKAN
jgi:NAD(P)-dependent dehydrogenase (short-subunit alcohol dehydrogenase family)